MTEFNIAIIEDNTLEYSDYERMNLTDEKIECDLEDYIILKKVKDSEDLMIHVVDNLQITPEEGGITSIVYIDEDYIYYLFHNYDIEKKQNNLNNISKIMTYGEFRITNNCVLLKNRVFSSGLAEHCNITMDDIIKIFKSFYIHEGTIIETNNNMETFRYVNNPIEWINNKDNIKYYEIEICDKVAMFFIDTTSTEFNYYASLLYGQRINGRVLLTFRNKPEDIRRNTNEYINFNKLLCQKLVCIMSENINELKIDYEKDNKNLIYNLYTIIKNKYNIYLKKNGNKVLNNKYEELEKTNFICFNK
jgi:hypothetical protein